jgi:hypothetical protein
MALSPLAYKAGVTEDAAHLRKGSATHALTYLDKPVAAYDGIRRGKEWEAFKVDYAGHVIVNLKEYYLAAAMAKAIRENERVIELGLLNRDGAVTETEIEWDFDGVPFSSTPDLHCPEFGVDLKTTKSAKPGHFERDILKYYYHSQGAIYKKAIQAKYGYTPKEWYIIACESKAPHDVVVYRLTPRILDLGERTAYMWLSELRNCEASGHWPGYTNAVVDVDVPDYMLKDDEDEDETEEESTEEAECLVR